MYCLSSVEEAYKTGNVEDCRSSGCGRWKKHYAFLPLTMQDVQKCYKYQTDRKQWDLGIPIQRGLARSDLQPISAKKTCLWHGNKAKLLKKAGKYSFCNTENCSRCSRQTIRNVKYMAVAGGILFEKGPDSSTTMSGCTQQYSMAEVPYKSGLHFYKWSWKVWETEAVSSSMPYL